MKCSDYIAEFLAERGVRDVFLVTGGAIAHVVDSLGERARTKGDIAYQCVIHEQAAAMAVETYSRLTKKIGVAMTTSGPGATNLITGICGCWFDSIPGLFITGQVNLAETTSAAKSLPRQVGFQETDIVAIAKPIVKFAKRVEDARDIRRVLEEAIAVAFAGRPGPVLVDIPLNIQAADIDPRKLSRYRGSVSGAKEESAEQLKKKVKQVSTLLKKSKRPLIVLGGGIRIADAQKSALSLIGRINAPTAVSWSGFDLLPYSHPLNIGHIGVYGSRSANFAVQNADLVIAIGSRLDTRQTGGKLKSFARHAKKVMVDIDRNEIEKGRGLSIDVGINADAGKFLKAFAQLAKKETYPRWEDWHSRVRGWRAKYRDPEDLKDKRVSPMNAYPFLRKLSDVLPAGEVVIANEGGNLVWTMQSFRIKKDQRLISTFGNSPMGYSFPAAIGAAFAHRGKRIICIDGDGGFQPNLQELQTVRYYDLPIKIFIMNNESMGIIKQFQDQYFGSRYYATSPKYGYEAPDFVKIAKAYGIPALRVSKLSNADGVIKKALAMKGPVLVDVRINRNQQLSPKLEFGRPLEDMSPYLDRHELEEAMIVPILPESKTIPSKRGWVTM
ncbi:MAG TPA: thiamine pyrophosphate-binding protein [Candidatus Paceibacterota bacterium]